MTTPEKRGHKPGVTWTAGLQFLGIRTRLLGTQQQLVMRKRDDADRAFPHGLPAFDLNTTQGQSDADSLRCSSRGLVGACLTAIRGGRMISGNETFAVAVRRRPGRYGPLQWRPRRVTAVHELLLRRQSVL